MQFGVQLYPYERFGTMDEIVRMCQVAERLGYSTISIPDHLAVPAGDPTDVIGAVWYDPFVLAAQIACHTETIRLRLDALVLPYREPIHTANLIATIDHVSHGRITLVVAAGWMEEEFEALGIPFAERGAITEEHIAAMRALWSGDTAEFSGKYYSFPPISSRPRCVQQPYVDLQIGGRGAIPWRRVAEFGDGWAPLPVTDVEDNRAHIAKVKEMTAAAGRDPEALAFSTQFQIGDVDADIAKAREHVQDGMELPPEVRTEAERIAHHIDVGFTHLNLVVGTWTTVDDLIEQLEEFAATHRITEYPDRVR